MDLHNYSGVFSLTAWNYVYSLHKRVDPIYIEKIFEMSVVFDFV